MSKKTLQPGDSVVVLSDYHLLIGTFIRENKKSVSVQLKTMPHGCTISTKPKCFNKEKVVHKDDSIVVVWEMWSGVNGRGSHRIEHEIYKEHRRKAIDWVRIPSYEFVWEEALGVEKKRQ